VKEHNVQRWIRLFLQALPAAAAGSSADERLDASAYYALKLRRDEAMPGVALVATALSPHVRPRYQIGRDAKLRVIGGAVGED
jgi:hypothetical protein